jgi:hypothetical protein
VLGEHVFAPANVLVAYTQSALQTVGRLADRDEPFVLTGDLPRVVDLRQGDKGKHQDEDHDSLHDLYSS